MDSMSGDLSLGHPRQTLLPSLVVFLVLVSAIQLVSPAAGEPTGDAIPVWRKGDSWSYEVDQDVNINLFEGLTIDHIKENWTRHVYQVFDEGGDTIYRIWETRVGVYQGSVSIDPWNLDVSVEVDAHGWSYYRAPDMAIINTSMNLTFSGSLPLVGDMRGGIDNFTSYDPPMPMLEYPLASGSWDVTSTVNTTSELYLLSPYQWTGWDNASDLWNLTVTVSGTSSRTVPAGTYDAFTVREVGTRENATRTLDVDRTWYYATEAGAAIDTFDGYQLVFTDYEYIPPNRPPEGPSGPVELTTEEDVPLPIDLRDHFTDPEGDEMSFYLQLVGTSAVNASIEGSGAEWTVVPGANWSGHLDLLAGARDIHMSETHADLVVNVTPVNDPPHVVEPPGDLVTDEDTALRGVQDVTLVFDDVDGDELVYEVDSSPGVSASLNGTGLDLVPDPDWVGRAQVNITARDPQDAEAVASFRLMVGSVNDPPTIVASGGPARVHEAEEGTFWVEVEDLDSTELVYRWSIDGDEIVQVTGTSFLFSPGDLGGGSVVLSVTVTDEWDAMDSLVWTITVLDSPSINSTDPPSPVDAEVGDTMTFMVEVEDADTAQPFITWTWRGNVVGTGNKAVILFGAEDVGTFELTVMVSDGVGSDGHAWNVTVKVPDLPPSANIGSPGNGTNMNVGDKITFTAVVDDEDPVNLSVRWFVDGSPVGTGVQVEYTASREGTIDIQLKVSDGKSEVTDSVSVEVDGEDDAGPADGSASGPWPYVVPALILLGIVVVILVLRARRDRTG